MYCRYTEDEIVSMFKAYSGYNLIPTGEDFIVDYFGLRVPICYANYLSDRAGSRIEHPPIPDDTFRARFIEYLAVIESIRDCTGIYQMAEIGASYAPFSAICAALALRKGVEKVILRPVEASSSGIESIKRNFEINGLLNDKVDIRITNAAVVGDYKMVYFPDIDCTVDNGASPQEEFSRHDIRGAALSMVRVKGIPLSFVISSFQSASPIDLLHIDIQGSERDSLAAAINSLNERVKRVMLATHSRPIDGQMLELFHKNGWTLIAEEPCDFRYRDDLSELEGMTIKDGSQYWVNNLLT